MRLDLSGPLFESLGGKMRIFFERAVPIHPNAWFTKLLVPRIKIVMPLMATAPCSGALFERGQLKRMAPQQMFAAASVHEMGQGYV